MVDDRSHKEGRGEMKYEIMAELDKIQKESTLSPIHRFEKVKQKNFIRLLRDRIEKI